MRANKIVPALGIAAAMALALPANAQQKITTQGVSDNEIKIGTHVDLSGPITMWGVPQRNGHIMRVEEQNAKGGVHGRKITLFVEDNGYDPKKGVLDTQKLIEQDKVFALVGVLGTAVFIPSMRIAVDDGIPFIFPGTNARVAFEPFNPLTFAMGAPYDSQIKAGVKYFAEKMGKKKVGIIFQDDDFGKSIRDAAVEQAKIQNVAVVAQEGYKRGETSFSSQVANLQRAGTDLVVLGTVPRETVGVMAEIGKAGWKVDAVANAGACAQATIALGKAAVEGLYVQCQFVPFDPANESAAVKDWIKRYETRFKIKADIAAALTYDMEDMVIIALDRAGRDLTAAKFLAGIESIKDYQDIFGSPPQTFGPHKHLGTEGFVLLRIEGGKFQRVVSFGG
jgi:ABC-type branched-subunit amino acid transport system substrate-binding protein